MTLVKKIVTKEKYDKVRKVERIAGIKIKDIYAPVVDCINGQWGLWNVMRCYLSGENYIADMELEVRTRTQEEAIVLWEKIQMVAFFEMKNGNSNIGQITDEEI